MKYPSKRQLRNYISLGGAGLSLTVFVLAVFQGLIYSKIAPVTVDEVTVRDTTNASDASSVLATQVLVSQFKTATVLTQNSLDSAGGNAAAVAAGKALLKSSTYTVSQPIIGFGVGSPSSGPGQYNWTQMDKRVGSGGVTEGVNEVVLNANGVPGWMRNEPDFGTAPNGTLYIEHAPLPEYYDDFGDLVAAAVVRYPNIKYVHVWSEMKGFFDAPNNKWKYEEYTAMYNQVYAKVKAVRPDVKIGGPYPTITSSSKGPPNYQPRGHNSNELKGLWGWADQRNLDVVKYWLQNKAGADFIAIDMKNHHHYDDEKVTASQPAPIPELVDQFEQNNKFPAAVSWIRGLNNSTYPGAANMPIWFAEWYSRWDTPDVNLGESNIAGQTNQGTEAQRAAVMTDGLIEMVKAGVQRAFLWGPQGEPNTNGWMHPLGLFTNTRVAGGGQATPFYATQKAIFDHFSAGTGITNATSSNASVELLASSSKLLMVNKSAAAQTTQVLGANFSLAPYEVALKDVPAAPAATPPPTTTPTSEAPSQTEQAQANSSGSGSSSGSDNNEATSTNPEAAKSNAAKLVDAFYNNEPITIGSLTIPAKPLKYGSFILFVISGTAAIVFERKRIAYLIRDVYQFLNHQLLKYRRLPKT